MIHFVCLCSTASVRHRNCLPNNNIGSAYRWVGDRYILTFHGNEQCRSTEVRPASRQLHSEERYGLGSDQRLVVLPSVTGYQRLCLMGRHLRSSRTGNAQPTRQRHFVPLPEVTKRNCQQRMVWPSTCRIICQTNQGEQATLTGCYHQERRLQA
jgi:hypothetical protein